MQFKVGDKVLYIPAMFTNPPIIKTYDITESISERSTDLCVEYINLKHVSVNFIKYPPTKLEKIIYEID